MAASNHYALDMVNHQAAREKQRVLGSTLHRLRINANLSGRELARRTDISQSKISRIECGEAAATENDIRTIGAALRLHSDGLADLIARARELKHETKSRAAADLQTLDEPEAVLEAERQARTVAVVTPWCIPALLQTKEYAETIVATSPLWLDVDERYRYIVARVERQAQLNNPTKHFRFLISQESLNCRFASVSIHRDALQSLLQSSERANVEIRCIAPAGLLRRVPRMFTVLDGNSVLADTPTGMRLLHGSREAAAYIDIFDALWEDALQRDAVVTMIREALAKLDSHESDSPHDETSLPSAVSANLGVSAANN